LLVAAAATINVYVANNSTKSALNNVSLLTLEALTAAETTTDSESTKPVFYRIILENCTYTYKGYPNTTISLYKGDDLIATLRTDAFGKAQYTISGGKATCQTGGDKTDCTALACPKLTFK
jgi:hypothetical protein